MGRWNFPDVSTIPICAWKNPLPLDAKKRSLRKWESWQTSPKKGSAITYLCSCSVGWVLLLARMHTVQCSSYRRPPTTSLPSFFPAHFFSAHFTLLAPPLRLFFFFFLDKKEPTWAGDSSVVESPKPTNLPVPRLVSACVNPQCESVYPIQVVPCLVQVNYLINQKLPPKTTLRILYPNFSIFFSFSSFFHFHWFIRHVKWQRRRRQTRQGFLGGFLLFFSCDISIWGGVKKEERKKRWSPCSSDRKWLLLSCLRIDVWWRDQSLDRGIKTKKKKKTSQCL